MSKLVKILSDKLDMPEEDINDDTAYNVTRNWDSVTHLEITSALEDEFGIEFDIDEITAMENVAKIKQILRKRGVKDI